MAGNQSRTVELQIKLQGVQSLQELEDVTSEINKELKQVSVNSKEFQKLGAMVQTANSKLKETGERLAGVTSTEKAEAVNKLGQGLVGAFQAGAGASLLFGEKTGEAMQKSIAKVASLFAITDGLKKLTEAFSAKNVAMLKATVKGWQESAVAVKLFGTATRTALAATGIGLLVVAIGLVAANWDKVKKAMISAFDYAKKFVPIFAAIGQVVDYLTEKVGNFTNLIAGLGGALQALFTGENIADGFEKGVKAQDELTKSTEAYNKTLTVGKEELDAQLALMDAQGATEAEKLDVQYKYIMGLVVQNKLIKERTPELDKQLKDSMNDLAILQAKINSNKKDTQLKEAERQKVEGERKKAAADRKAAADAILEQNRLKRIAIQVELEKIAWELKSQEILEKYNEDYQKLLNNYNESLTLTIRNNDEYNIAIDKINQISESLNIVREASQEISNFNREDGMLWMRKYKTHLMQLEAYSQEENFLQIALGLRNELHLADVEEDSIRGGIIFKGAVELKIFKDIEALKQKGYQRDLQELENRKALLEKQKEGFSDIIAHDEEDAQRKLDAYNQQLLYVNSLKAAVAITGVGSDMLVEQSKILATVNQERIDANQQILRNQEEIVSISNEQAAIDNSIALTNVNIANSKDAITKKSNVIIGTIKEEIQTYKILQGAIAQYGEEIQAAQDLINASFELASAISQRRAEMAQRELDDYKKANDEKLASDIKLYEDGASARKSINDELQELMLTAEGDRYDDLKAQQEKIAADEAAALAAKLAAEAEYNKQVALMQYEIDVAKWQSEKREKAGALISAAIQGALAVIEALPNIPLSIIVGAAALAGIATIAAQPLSEKPKKPEKAEKGGLLQGASHAAGGVKIEAEGGEYIINKRATSQWLPLLEAINMPKFANGGQVSVPNVVNNIPQMDYARIGNEVALAIKANPMFVSVVEFRNVENRLNVVENRASIGKK